MLRSVQRLERHGGFRPRVFDNRSREYLDQAIAQLQGTEVQAPAPVILNDAHERLEASFGTRHTGRSSFPSSATPGITAAANSPGKPGKLPPPRGCGALPRRCSPGAQSHGRLVPSAKRRPGVSCRARRCGLYPHFLEGWQSCEDGRRFTSHDWPHWRTGSER